jgi:acyl carrier protein
MNSFRQSLRAIFMRRRTEIERAQKYMEGRPSLTAQEYSTYYFPQEEADVAAQVRTMFSQRIDLDVSRVHPDDRLVDDLRMDALDSMSTIEFVMDLEKHFNIDIPDRAAVEMRTLNDITAFIVRHER